MKKTVEIEIDVTGTDIAEELWSMDCDEQANFLSKLSRLHGFNKVDFLVQLQYVADEINCGADIYNKASIVKTLETVLEYVKGEEETETWNGFHGQLEVPKGTFDKIWNDEEGEVE